MFSAALVFTATVAVSWQAPAPDPLPGLEALRSGRFQEARASFDRIAVSDPSAPEGPFFQAFHIWWRLLDRPADADSKPLRLEMEEHLREAIERATVLAARAEPRESQRGLVFSGISLFLEAESKVARGSAFAAASSVRRGHRALSRVLEADPGSADALFAMGTYNYYADHVSLLVKGLRFVLAIPGGDEQKGIEQLEAAAARSRMFGTESLLLLAHIFSGNYAHDYGRALGYLEAAATRHVPSPLLTLIRADLLFRLGRVRESADLAESALAMVKSNPGYLDDLRWLSEHRLAACALALHDPIEALGRIESNLETSPPAGPVARKRWLSLLASAAREAGAQQRAERWVSRLQLTPDEAASLRRRASGQGPSGMAAARAAALHAYATGLEEQAIRTLEHLLELNPTEPRLHYDLGRALQSRGRLDEARPHLKAALSGASGPQQADIMGRSLIRLGWDLEKAGRRGEAIGLYRRAAEIKSFVFRDAALDLVDRPAANQPEG